jgi:hypothetical protein
MKEKYYLNIRTLEAGAHLFTELNTFDIIDMRVNKLCRPPLSLDTTTGQQLNELKLRLNKVHN